MQSAGGEAEEGEAVASYQQVGPDVGDLVQLHEESQSLLVVTAVLAVHRETLPLHNTREAHGLGGLTRSANAICAPNIPSTNNVSLGDRQR